jgi:H+/Cl- antiporter ClcA
MKTYLSDKCTAMLRHCGALAKWMLVGALIGSVGGLIGSAFHMGVDFATTLRLNHPWVLYLMPVGGLAIVGLYKLAKTEGKGTNAIIESVHFGANVPVILVPVIFLATVITHLVGGSAGREGAALQIGGGIGHSAGKLLRMGEKDLPLATLCGMAGVFSALFGTPLTATLFALEVISVGVLYYAGLVPCITASMMGYVVSHLMGVAPTRFRGVPIPRLDVVTMVKVTALAAAAAVVSILFVRALHLTEKGAGKYLKSPWLRIVAGSAVLIGLSLLTGGDYNGAGMDVITRATAGEADALAWVWKIVFTALTIGVGFKGGEVVPSFFVGATFGCFAGGLLGIDPGFGAALGLIAVFCGAVNCPLASMVLSMELFGGRGLLYFAMTCAVSYALSGYCGLYSSQTILYSKLRAEYINLRTKE